MSDAILAEACVDVLDSWCTILCCMFIRAAADVICIVSARQGLFLLPLEKSSGLGVRARAALHSSCLLVWFMPIVVFENKL